MPERQVLTQIVNKVDLVAKGEAEELKEWFSASSRADTVILTSAMLGSGVEEAKRWAAEQLSQGPSLYSKVGGCQECQAFRELAVPECAIYVYLDALHAA